MSRSLICAWSLLFLVSPFPSFASDASAPEQVGEIETMVVTAHRVPVALGNTASAVAVLDRSEIDARQQTFAADLLRDLPGASLSRTSTNGSLSQIRVRGAEANHLLVIVDGVELNDPAGGDEFDFGSLTSYDIESIELVRGPQSALWGSDAMAGVLRISTRTGRQGVQSAAFMEGGSFGTLSGGGRISGGTERARVSLSASRYSSDGVSAAASGTEKDGYENTTVGLSGSYELRENFRIGFSGRHTEDSVEFDGTDIEGMAVDADNETEKTIGLMGLTADLDLLDQRWRNSLRFTYLDTESDNRGDFPSRYAAEKTGAYFQSSFELGGRSLTAHRLSIGVDYEDEDFTQRTGFSDQDLTLDNLGIALEYYLQPLEPLTLSASVRHDDNSEFKGVTTWRSTAAYRFAATGTRLKASAGTGQKRPGFVERFGFSADFFIGNPDLKPERNLGWEVGIDQQLLDGALSIGATYFDERLEDEIVLIGFPSTPVNLDEKSRRSGAELELAGRLTESLRLSANYTYTHSSQPDGLDGSVREIRRPRHQAAINLDHRLLDGRGNVNLNLSYTGGQTDTLFSFPARTVTLDAYTLANLTGEYRATPWLTLFARAENLFDEKQEDVAGFQNPGRGFYGGVRMELDR